MVLYTNKNIPLLLIPLTCLLEELHRYTYLVVLPPAPSLLAVCPNSHHQHYQQLYKNNPQLALLGLGMETWDTSHHIILTHILIEARLSITRKWNDSAPSSQLLPQLLNQHLQMELMFTKAN